jgi:hypothetical protein
MSIVDAELRAALHAIAQIDPRQFDEVGRLVLGLCESAAKS